MKTSTIVSFIVSRISPDTTWTQSVLLLLLRLAWGVQFAQTGWGKLHNLSGVTDFFTELGIPLPHLNAIVAGATECFGGLFLAMGVASRWVSLPLIFTMIVAYATADKEAVQAIFTDFDQFTKAAPFPFLFACLVIAAFGPGRLSLDHVLANRLTRNA